MPLPSPSNYVSQQNQTVAGQLQSSLVSAGQSTGNFIANELTAAGHAVSSVGNFVSSSLDTLLSGSEVASFFGSGSPQRISKEALYTRFGMNQNVNPNDKIDTSQGHTTAKINLSYPLDQAPYYMKLQFFKYVRINPLEKTTIEPIGIVNLPLPDASGFMDSTNANWDQAKGGIVGNVLDQVKNLSDLLSNPKAIVGDALYGAALTLIKDASAEAGNVLSTVSGIASNPSLAMVFNGVNFRSFTLNWTFVPQNAAESEMIKRIVNYIKLSHLPTFAGDKTSYYFNYPSVVQPSFVGIIDPDYITKFKKCVIKSVNVNYAPHSHPSFYKTSQAPTAIQLSIGLDEMEYVMSSDYGGSFRGDPPFEATKKGAKQAFSK